LLWVTGGPGLGAEGFGGAALKLLGAAGFGGIVGGAAGLVSGAAGLGGIVGAEAVFGGSGETFLAVAGLGSLTSSQSSSLSSSIFDDFFVAALLWAFKRAVLKPFGAALGGWLAIGLSPPPPVFFMLACLCLI